MRRLGAIIGIAGLLVISVAPPAIAAKPPGPGVVSVTITANGGSWPYCAQVATVTYTAAHQLLWLDVRPALDGAPTEDHMVRVRLSGTVDIAIAGHDYSDVGTYAPNDPWRWVVAIWGHKATAVVMTSTVDFHHVCQAPGTEIAWYPVP